MTHTIDIAPPVGAEADVWLEDGYREVYNAVGVVVTGTDFMRCPLVTVVANQYRDGHLEDIKVEIDDAGHQPLTAEQSIEFANYVLEAAAIVNQWTGGDH